MATAGDMIHISVTDKRVQGWFTHSYFDSEWEEGNNLFLVTGKSISFNPCHQDYSEMCCCNASVLRPSDSCHSPLLQEEFIYLRLYLMHTCPVCHTGSSARWILKPARNHSAKPACWHSPQGTLSGAASSWLLVQTCVYRLWVETPLDFRGPSSPEQILLMQ